MIVDVIAVTNARPAGIFYVRKPTLFGNEAEFRWKRYFNSRCWCVKIEYNLPDDEDAAIRSLILMHYPGARVVP
jgi:hypothetical protein